VTKNRVQILIFVCHKCFIIAYHTRISGGKIHFYWKSRSGLGDVNLSTSWGRGAAASELHFDIADSIQQQIETRFPDQASIFIKEMKEKASN